MPGEFSKAECDSHAQVLEELHRDYAELWAEFSNVLQRFHRADADFVAALEPYDEALYEWADVQFLTDVAEEQLSRCRQRNEADCRSELENLEAMRVRLDAANQRVDVTRARWQEAEDQRDMLLDQLGNIGKNIDSNGKRTVVRENRMRNGHCHRFKTP